jgi:N-hydroxyarylamine O-acetyltransferase
VSFDLDAYLARIDMPARPTIDAAGLARLQRQHRLAIPFENLDVMLGRGIAIDGDVVFAKLVGSRRGGYCWEQNRLFGDALAALGFEARPITARVWLGAEGVPPLTHVLSLVEAEGRAWIADAGFGGSYAPVMPLEDGAEADAPDGARFRLTAGGLHGWTLARRGPVATTDGRRAGDDEWQPQFSFTLAPVHDADLAMGNWWSQSHPTSRFTRVAIASIVLPHGFATLADHRYRRSAAGQDTEGEITDPRVYRMRLGLLFGIELSAEEAGTLFRR